MEDSSAAGLWARWLAARRARSKAKQAWSGPAALAKLWRVEYWVFWWPAARMETNWARQAKAAWLEIQK